MIDLVNIMGKKLKKKPMIQSKPKRKGEMLKTLSNKKLLKEFGKHDFIKFENGIKKLLPLFKRYHY